MLQPASGRPDPKTLLALLSAEEHSRDSRKGTNMEPASQRALEAILRGLARGRALSERQADAIARELVEEAENAMVRNHGHESAALQRLADLMRDEFEPGG